MKERLSESVPDVKSRPKKAGELNIPKKDLIRDKQEYLGYVKDLCMEIFNEEKLPKELIQQMIDIRKQITARIESAEYVDEIENFILQQIAQLAIAITNYKKSSGEERAVISEDGEISIVTVESRLRALSENEEALFNYLELYFDTYRISQNSKKFSRNVTETEQEIVANNVSRKLNFYSDEEKIQSMVGKLQEKYTGAGFTETELKELVGTCKLKDLDQIEIHDLKILANLRNIFQKFMDGDKTKYIALSAGLLVPAFLEGYAPMYMANIFQDGRVDLNDVTSLSLFTLLTSSSAGMSLFLEKQFGDFLNKNFSKDSGIGEHISKNIAEFPAEQMESFGPDHIKVNISGAKDGYQEVFSLVSFDILPAVVTLVTSAVMLYDKSPVLAGATAAGSGLLMVLDTWLEKATGWQSKKTAAREQTKNLARNISEHLNAHLEIILSGMKDELSDRLEDLLAKDRQAVTAQTYANVVRNTIEDFFGTLNLIVAGVIASLTGAGIDKFFAALAYSKNFQSSISKILRSKGRLLNSFRDIVEMDVMFNGYAAEEDEKEKGRIGMEHIQEGTIKLTGVQIDREGKTILDIPELSIPEGSMVYVSGASGAGKTTFIKVISGYYRPSSGEVTFGDVDMDKIKKSGKNSIYSAISYLPQFPYVLEDTVRKNIIFGLPEHVSDEKIKEVLQDVGLGERFKNLNEPLKGGRGDMGTASGGETSRLGLARLLLKIRNTDSKLVFLDEPTASVDEKTKNDIVKIINKEKSAQPGVTFAVISHDKEFVKKLSFGMEVRIEKGKLTSVS